MCDRDYYLHAPSGGKGGCVACSEGKSWLGPVVGFVIFLFLGAALVVFKTKLHAFATQNRTWISKLSQKFVLFLVALQIVTVLKTNHDSLEGARTMAEPYQTYLAVTSVVDLDIAQILPLNCISGSPMNHLDVLLMTTLVPVGAVLILLFILFVLGGNRVIPEGFLQVLLFAYPASGRSASVPLLGLRRYQRRRRF